MKKSFYLPGIVIGCILLFSITARAASLPIFSAYPVNDTVCSGTAAYYTIAATDTSGTATVTTFSWQVSTNEGLTWTTVTNGGPYSGADSTTLVITSNHTLSGYLYRGVATNTIGSALSAPAVLVVDSAGPATISGPASVCVGTTVTLTPSIPGGAWSATNDSASVSASGVVTGLLANGTAAGLDTLYYNLTNTCGSTADTFIIMINASPAAPGVITGSSIVCVGNTITLADVATGGTWSRRHAGVDSVSVSGVVGGIHQGYDTISYTTTNGICSLSATHAVRVDSTVTALPVSGPSFTCAGHSIDLFNANVLGTGVWSVSNAHASIVSSGVLTGVSGGMDTVVYTFTNACNTVTSSFPVEIDNTPSTGVISGPASVCAGSSIHLSETVTGGTWTTSDPSLAVVDASGNVNGVAMGTPVISYVITNGCGSFAATMNVTVIAPAAPIAGIDSIGIDSIRVFTDPTPGGSWSVANPAIAIISSTGVVTGLGEGTTTITYTVTNICGTSRFIQAIYVAPLPFLSAIGGTDSVCLGNTIVLTNAAAGGIWSSSRPSIATVSSGGLVTGIAYGQAYITYSYANAFGANAVVAPVFVNQPPVVSVSGPNVIAVGGDYFLFGYPYGGTWTASNGAMGAIVYSDVFDTGIVVAPRDTLHNTPVTFCSFVITKAGGDTLTYTVHNTCGTRSNSFVLSLPVSHVSAPVITAAQDMMHVYPNPNTGDFNLNVISATTEDVSVSITNMVGEKVKELVITSNKNYNIKLDQPDGIYIVNATTASGDRYFSRVMIAK